MASGMAGPTFTPTVGCSHTGHLLSKYRPIQP